MKKDNDMPEAEDLENLVVVTDDAGKETYYREEMVIPLKDKNFAILVEDSDEEDNAVIARIDFDQAGEPIYLDPTDEEFTAVMAAYDRLMSDTKEEED